MGQRVYYGFFLGGEHEEVCSVVGILPIWSDMSRKKMKLKMATQKQIQVTIIFYLKSLLNTSINKKPFFFLEVVSNLATGSSIAHEVNIHEEIL